MKKIVLSLALLPLCVVLLTAFFNPDALKVQFARTDWDNAKRKAINEKKLFFVDFDASYCAACRSMEATTYMDPSLADYMAQHVVAHKVDVQDFDGVMWAQAYEVDALPTLLVFDSKGKLAQRAVGYKSAADLMRMFKEVRERDQPEPVPAKTGMQSESGMETTIVGDKKVPEPAKTSENAGNNLPVGTLSAGTAVGPTGMGLFEVASRRHKSEGFAVQIGVYASYETALERISELKATYADRRTLLHGDLLDGQTVYKILLGTFASRREAGIFASQLKQKNGIEGLVKDLSFMK